jgi:xanthine/uracil permease
MKAIGYDGEAAYGAMLGTSMVCCLVEVFFSFLPIDFLKKLFPPLITSITVILLGITLIGAGMKAWGGGAVCADMEWKNHAQLQAANITDLPPPTQFCANGETRLLYGSPEYIGLGFIVLLSLVVIEIFGSVFMKNCNVIIALCIAYIVAAITDYNGLRYINSEAITAAEPITFVWVQTFPLGFYGPAVVPLIVAYLVTTVETVGDIAGECS